MRLTDGDYKRCGSFRNPLTASIVLADPNPVFAENVTDEAFVALANAESTCREAATRAPCFNLSALLSSTSSGVSVAIPHSIMCTSNGCKGCRISIMSTTAFRFSRLCK